ncbi:serine threonine-protein kinase endoribonuclease ire-1 [Hordeum vulgare]|nr:serine threonine-protein kinase endoribonuclease ire-1 [Hordeum vulgare]
MDATCSICGNDIEDEYHAVIMCTKSRSLRSAMREKWNLPAEGKFWHTGNDWLQVLLDTVNDDMQAKILLLAWRCWFLREDNVQSDGESSAGVVARDHWGLVLFSSCRKLLACSSVEEAEARAAWVGIQELANLTKSQVIVELDNKTIDEDLTKQKPTRSTCYGIVMDIQRIMASFSEFSIRYTLRSKNLLEHNLAALTRNHGEQRMFADVPDNLRSLMLTECPSNSEYACLLHI